MTQLFTEEMTGEANQKQTAQQPVSRFDRTPMWNESYEKPGGGAQQMMNRAQGVTTLDSMNQMQGQTQQSAATFNGMNQMQGQTQQSAATFNAMNQMQGQMLQGAGGFNQNHMSRNIGQGPNAMVQGQGQMQQNAMMYNPAMFQGSQMLADPFNSTMGESHSCVHAA